MNGCEDKGVEELELYAWVGRDELAPAGQDEVGIKGGITQVGYIPLVAVKRDRMESMAAQLQNLANAYGKTVRLCKFKFVEEVMAVRPNG